MLRSDHCSHCGHDLTEGGAPVPLGTGPAAVRRLWYARQASDLVHADEVIALMGSSESEAIVAAYGALADQATALSLNGVSLSLRRMCVRKRPTVGWLEALFSALWRLDEEVLTLFSPTVRKAMRSDFRPPPSR